MPTTIRFADAPTNISVTGQTIGSNATWTVLGIDNENNYSDQSDGLLVQMPIPASLTFTDPIIVDSVTDTSIDISWAPAVPATYPLTWYFIYLDNVLQNSLTPEILNYQFTGLDQQTSYDIDIVVWDSNFDSASATTVTQVTQEALPSAPSSLIATDITETTFTLHWIPSNTFDGNDNGIVKYEIYKNGVNTNNVVGTPPSSSIGLVGLTSEATNFWQVLGEDDQGLRSEISIGINVTQAGPTPPAPDAPTGLQAVQEIPGLLEVELSWDLQTNVDSFVIYQSTNGSTFNEWFEVVTNYWTDYNVLPDQTYWYKLKAKKDGVLSDNFSNTAQVFVGTT